MSNPNHLKLWNSVERTDPSQTKSFSRSGGFKGTAISPMYLIRKATEKFGPVGSGWGFDVEDEKYAPGAPLDGGGQEIIHVVRIKLWAKMDDGTMAEFPVFGQTTFVGKNKYGAFTDEEAPKKSLTDAISKGLSWLGFSADVHMGKFDDNKYVNDRKREEAQQQNFNADEARKTCESALTKRLDDAEKARGIVQDAVDRWEGETPDRQWWVDTLKAIRSGHLDPIPDSELQGSSK